MWASPPLVAAEVATLEYKGGDDNWYPLLVGGSALEISATESKLKLDFPILVRVQKAATVSSTAIHGHFENDV